MQYYKINMINEIQFCNNVLWFTILNQYEVGIFYLDSSPAEPGFILMFENTVDPVDIGIIEKGWCGAGIRYSAQIIAS